MKQLIVLLILALLVTGVNAYWSEKIDVLAVDTAGRPIKGATIIVVYQSFNCVTHYDIIKLTDATGIAHFEFINTIPEAGVTENTTCVEKTYSIISSFVGITNKTSGSINRANKKYEIRFPVTYHTLNVRDAYGFPLVPSTAEYQNLSFETDANGQIFLSLPIGRSIDINVTYGNITKTITRKENSETSSTINFSVYDLKVKLYNEKGSRIEGIVIVENRVQTAKVDKPAIFERFAYEEAAFNIVIGDVRKTVNKNITRDTVDLYVDLSPPSIRDLSVGLTSSKDLEISVIVVDEGEFSSGLLTNPVVYYNKGEEWEETKMFPTSALSYEATIPSKGNNTKYRISAEDLQGNIGVHEGNYTFTEVIEPKPPEPDENKTINTTVNNTPADTIKDTEPQVVELSLTHILGAIIFVIIVIFIYQRIREKL